MPRSPSVPRSLPPSPSYLHIVTIPVHRGLSASHCLPPGPAPLRTVILRALPSSSTARLEICGCSGRCGGYGGDGGDDSGGGSGGDDDGGCDDDGDGGGVDGGGSGSGGGDGDCGGNNENGSGGSDHVFCDLPEITASPWIVAVTVAAESPSPSWAVTPRTISSCIAK